MQRWVWCITVIALFLVVGCQRGGQDNQTVVSGLAVRIDSPASNARIPTGREVTIVSTASDPALVQRVELYVNGQLIHDDRTPVEAGQETFKVDQRWVPPAPGTVRVEVIAYNAQGRASRPAAITLIAEGPGLATTAPLPSRTPTLAVSPTSSPFPSPTVAQPTTPPQVVEIAGVVSVDANIRGGPGQGNPRIDGLFTGASVTAIARNELGDWVKIRYGSNQTGWVSGGLVNWQGDIGTLPVTTN